MNTLDVYTVGGIDFLIQVLRYIVLLLGDNTWKTALMITFIFSTMIAYFIGFKRRTYPLLWFFTTFLAFHILFSLKVNLNLIDTKLGKTYVISNVPFGIGISISVLSTMSHYATSFIDNAFHTGITYIYGGSTQNSYPQALDFSKNGYAGVYEYFDRLQHINIDKYLPPDKREIVNAYLTQCFLPDLVSWSDSEVRSFQFSPDVIQTDKLRVKTNLLMSYRGQTFYCINFYDNYAKRTLQDFVNLISNNVSLLALLRDTNTLKGDMSSVVNAFTGGSQTFAQIIGNAAVREALKNAYTEVASSSTELSQNIVLGYMKGESESRFMLMAKAFFMYAAEWIPILNNALLFVLIGIMPFVAGLIFIPGMLSLVKKFLLTITWVYLWFPILALVDGIHKTAAIAQAQNYVSTLYSTAGFGIGNILNISTAFSIASAGNLYEITDDMKALAGFLALWVPGIAWMVLTASDHVISGFGSMLASQVGRVANPETITQAVRAEQVGMQLSDGELGHGIAVRQAVWGNAYSMAQSYATNNLALENVKDVFKSATYTGAKSVGMGSAMYDTLKGDVDYMKKFGASALPKELTEGLMFNGRLSNAIQQVADRTYSNAVSQSVKDVWQAGEKYTESKQFSDSVMYATSKSWGKSDSYITSKYSKYSEAVETFKGVQEETSNILGLSKKDSASVANELFAVGSIDGSILEKASKGDSKALRILKNVISRVNPELGDKISDQQLQEWAKTIDTKYGEKISSGDTFKQLVQLEKDFKHDDQAKKELNYAVKGEEGVKINWNEELTWAENVSNEIGKVKTIQDRLSDIRTKSSAYEMQYGHQFLQFVADEYYGGNLAKAKANINYATPQQMDMWVSDFLATKLGINPDGNIDTSKLEKERINFEEKTKNLNLEGEDRNTLKTEQLKKMGDKFVENHERGTDEIKGKEGILIGQAKYKTQSAYYGNKKAVEEQQGSANTIINGGKNYIDGKAKNIEGNSNKTKQEVEGNINLGLKERMNRLFKNYGNHLALIGATSMGNFAFDVYDILRDKDKGGMHHTTVDMDGKGNRGSGTVPEGKTERRWTGKAFEYGKTLGKFTLVGTAAYVGWETGTQINNYFGDWIYNHITDPVLSTLDRWSGGMISGVKQSETVKTFQTKMYKPIYEK